MEAQARALKSSGLAALGYRYVNLDDTAVKGTSQRAGQIADPAVSELNYNCGHMDGLDYGQPAAQRY